MYRYFLTFCTDARRSALTSEGVVSSVQMQFRRSAGEFAFAITAHCFMPDHLHVLCEAKSTTSDLVAFVTGAKQRSAYQFARTVGGRLWQKGFYDHVLREEESALAVVRYIMANPVRAGLARVIGEYPFCGSDVYPTRQIEECVEMWNPASAAIRTARQP